MLPSQYQDALRRAFCEACKALGGDGAAAVIEKPAHSAHGDFACPAAMSLAKTLKCPPRAAAGRLLDNFAVPDFVAAVDIAGPGFVNIRLKEEAKLAVVPEILRAGEDFGRAADRETDILLEFVSANPTGPLHIGHGRAAAYGDSLANILRFAGYRVHREYYVNDSGRQTDILAASVWLRYWLAASNDSSPMPDGSYRGEYLRDVARRLDDILSPSTPPDMPSLLADMDACGDIDKAADLLVQKMARAVCAKTLARRVCREMLTTAIQKDLAALRVSPFDQWFQESALHDEGQINRAVQKLQQDNPGVLRQTEDGALWLRSTLFGDDKDRVICRADGRPTYFAADIAYHYDKLTRVWPSPPAATARRRRLVNVLGADHHGYLSRLQAAVAAFGYTPDILETQLIQLVSLVENGVKIKMSTRAGEFVALSSLIEKIGVDAARYFYVSRKNDQHLEMDVNLARAQNNANPVYYIQYAHARICGIFAKWGGDGGQISPQTSLASLGGDDGALPLCAKLLDFAAVPSRAAEQRAPHLAAVYLHELAAAVHGFYEKTTVLGVEGDAVAARLALLAAARQVLQNGLKLLGVSAPERLQ